jgi:NADH-quinone oxidoreductase subunit G
MDNMIDIIVDEKTYQVKEGSLLIDLLIKENIKVPYLCYHQSLGADGNCRMCMVEIEGQKRPQIACDTFVKKGMEVRSKGENIEQVRTDILELELINHPVDCPVCDQAGECSLQDFYMDYGLHDTKVSRDDKVKHNKHLDLGSNVMLDQERCVLCARCTRFTDKITHTHELGIVGRGDEAKVTTMPGRELDNEYAMNIIDLCPVGAMTSKDFRFQQRVWFLNSADAICHGCAKGCNIFIDHNKAKYKDDIVYRFRPRRNDEVNGFFICDDGRLSYKELNLNRADEILLQHKQIDENQAVDELNNLFKNSTKKAFIIDANLYNEEIDAIVELAKKTDAKLFAPLDIYDDESFEDEMLKCRFRAANYKKIKDMSLANEFDGECDLVINFNHPQEFKANKVVNFITHKRENGYLNLPIAAYSENSGTLTNIDGIVQKSKKAVFKNNPALSISEWLLKVEL